MARVQGTVKWFDDAKGYGFIKPDSGADCFAHYKQIKGEGRRTLADGQRVSFTVAQGQKGPQAENIEVL
jgi:CspA family cold shock protein